MNNTENLEYNIDQSDFEELWILCKKFIKDHKIGCCEQICQSDDILDNCPDFVEDICKIVGYDNS